MSPAPDAPAVPTAVSLGASGQVSRKPSQSIFCGGGGELRVVWNHSDFSLNQLVKLVLLPLLMFHST